MNVFNNVVGAQPVSELSASSAQSEVKAQMHLDSYTTYTGGARLSLSAAHATANTNSSRRNIARSNNRARPQRVCE